ncbi:PAS domain S-box protein [Chryseobacterium sp. G0162]|uniref:PAS domain-containing sensor histidine kinase n=1 Tax=Chryseobacterium sp. G0162 TaxID=2487063 RepID=UPI000F4D78AF|nr:ATP-binding protein [Chryseobacterium sp. G0162]AZB07343.1 PAS domain S-box protein [Chryseobacterium sp. G0162]
MYNADLKLYLQALNSSNSGIVITDNSLEDNPIIYCNKAFEIITGYSRDEIIGHNCRFLQRDDKFQIAQEEIKKGIKLNKDVRTVIRNYKKNGELFWNELFISPVIDHDGKTTHFIGVQNDITLQKEIEHELREEKASVEKKVQENTKELIEKEMFLSSIIQTVRESLLVLDGDFKVLSANNHFLKTFKVSSEDTIGKILYELGNHQWDIEMLHTMLVKILPTNNPIVDFEVEHEFPNIGRKTMVLNAYRIEFEGQYKDRILLAIEDATERKEIEKRKDDFLSIASHELKTPLTTIKGLVQILQRFSKDDSNDKYFSTVNKIGVHVERLNNLISDLLDTSKIQSGHIESHLEPVDLLHIVESCIENFKMTNSSQEIIMRINTIGPIVYADESQIIQVVNNILSNAVKYSPKSQSINITVSQVSNFAKVSIKDDGIGISYDDKIKIFERFYRAGSSQKKYPGMGIGLYISKKIIDNHKGSLWVESSLGKGSVFSFTLPIYKK